MIYRLTKRTKSRRQRGGAPIDALGRTIVPDQQDEPDWLRKYDKPASSIPPVNAPTTVQKSEAVYVKPLSEQTAKDKALSVLTGTFGVDKRTIDQHPFKAIEPLIEPALEVGVPETIPFLAFQNSLNEGNKAPKVILDTLESIPEAFLNKGGIIGDTAKAVSVASVAARTGEDIEEGKHTGVVLANLAANSAEFIPAGKEGTLLNTAVKGVKLAADTAKLVKGVTYDKPKEEQPEEEEQQPVLSEADKAIRDKIDSNGTDKKYTDKALDIIQDHQDRTGLEVHENLQKQLDTRLKDKEIRNKIEQNGTDKVYTDKALEIINEHVNRTGLEVHENLQNQLDDYNARTQPNIQQLQQEAEQNAANYTYEAEQEPVAIYYPPQAEQIEVYNSNNLQTPVDIDCSKLTGRQRERCLRQKQILASRIQTTRKLKSK